MIVRCNFGNLYSIHPSEGLSSIMDHVISLEAANLHLHVGVGYIRDCIFAEYSYL
jgi:hypothetical protein